MLGPGTYLELAGRKMCSRWGRTLFTMLCISLGVSVLAAVSSLVEGVQGTMLGAARRARSMRDDVIWLTVRGGRDVGPGGPEGAKKGKLSFTEEDRRELLARPGVIDVSETVGIYPVGLDLPAEVPRHSGNAEGATEAYMRRYLAGVYREKGLPSESGRVPVVVGCHFLNLRYDETSKIFRLNRDFRPVDWIGREFELVVGDNYLGICDPFQGAWREGRALYERVDAKTLAKNRRRRFDDLARRWDMNLYDRTLRLKAVIVGFSDFESHLIPLDVAEKLRRWLQLRAMIARLGDGSARSRGARRLRPPGPPAVIEPPEKRYHRLRMVVDDPEKVEAMRQRLDDEGYGPRTLDSSMVEELKVMERVGRIVRRFLYGLGFLLVCVSGCFIWLTVSKSVSDSRKEIGVLRAVGATRGCILRVFLLEAGLLGLGGGGLGILLGWGLAWLLSLHSLRLALANVEKLAMSGMAYRLEEVLPETLFHPDPWAAAAILGVTVLVSCLAGFVPSLRAAWVDPVRALRYE